ncbi:hypothetical protein GCM10022280_10830 [Sphingomonas swuensis]|uniref:OmpA-like domain-containing protein n=1 Tax=Sphingomonas swuensis TaxID=977800 RepID=A0ABP7SNH6_9SPHN
MLIAALLAATSLPPIKNCPGKQGWIEASLPCPAMIFFDSGSEEVRRDWEPAIDDAARVAARPGHWVIVTGYSDATGSAEGNRRISLRRARAVADALVTKGVPGSAILLRAGEPGDLLVPTPAGVREIQNRRVEIFIRPGPGIDQGTVGTPYARSPAR